jgi:hypothetical protein
LELFLLAEFLFKAFCPFVVGKIKLNVCFQQLMIDPIIKNGRCRTRVVEKRNFA